MTLCDLCKSIQLEDLPPFPTEKWWRTVSGKPRFHHLALKGHATGEPIERFGVQYHSNLDSLRKAAAGGCELCKAIETEADALLEEISNLSEPRRGAMQCEPEWDMWMTKRADAGGDGLWVVCRSTWESDRWLIPIASIGFASDEADPHSSGSTSRVLKEIPDQTTLNRIADWLKKCDDHPYCRARNAPMPTRLLDVGTSDSSSFIKLVEPDADLCDHYVTLSYCWGQGTKHFTTTRETIHARKEGFELDMLPQTLRDAVTVTRLLGVRYLWIDSLCICQNDLKDWEKESAQMAAVYSNSYLTLAADKSNNTNGGLLSSRTPRSYFRLPRSSGEPDKYILACALPLEKEVLHHNHVQMKDEPLSSRAWGFQERVLARRTLHFARDQMYWECIEGHEAEEGLALPYRLPYVSTDAELIAYAEKRKEEYYKPDQTMQHYTPSFHSWINLIWEYGPRELTNPADKLPAFSGVAKAFGKLLDDEYLAGLWRGSLIEGLCWQALHCKAVEGYRAPSWSWASVDGIPGTGFMGKAEEQAKILDAKVEIDGDNPFGRVKDGWIKLEAPMVKVTLAESKGPTGHLLFKTEKGKDDMYGMLDTIDRNYEASADLIGSMEVYALILAYTFGGPTDPDPERENPCAHGLFVTPDADRPGCMRRIGAVLHDVKDFGPDELSSRATVTIV